VINQSGQTLMEGRTYRAVTLGKEVIDPQSGLSLGPTESPCCTVVIDRVAQNLSYGHILKEQVDLHAPFTPGSMELREEVPGAAHSPTVMHTSATTPPRKPGAGAGAAAKTDANW
jgi:hypothetical protein